MGPRNLLILFFSTVAVSLVILIIFFSLFFKNVDLNFNTRLPESAPDLGGRYSADNLNKDSKADGLSRSTVNVPPEFKEPAATPGETAKDAETEPSDTDLPPVSDDVMLGQDDEDDSPPSAIEERSSAKPIEKNPANAPSRPPERLAPIAPPPAPRTVERRPVEAAPGIRPAQPVPIEAEPSNGPPVPSQDF